jgi:hypothetical protein
MAHDVSGDVTFTISEAVAPREIEAEIAIAAPTAGNSWCRALEKHPVVSRPREPGTPR